MSVRDLSVRNSAVRHIMQNATEGLIYLGIAVTFASVVFIAWLALLLIW